VLHFLHQLLVISLAVCWSLGWAGSIAGFHSHGHGLLSRLYDSFVMLVVCPHWEYGLLLDVNVY